MLVFPQMDPKSSHGFLFGRSDPRGPPAFNIEMRQQKPQEEEIPIQAMVALKISRKHRPQRHRPYDLPSWGQIKTLTIIKLKMWFLNRECLGVLKIFLLPCLLCLLVPPRPLKLN